MANPFQVGPFLATMRNFGTDAEPEFRLWARHLPTGRDEFYGLSAAGYTSAVECIAAMRLAAGWPFVGDPDLTEEIASDEPLGGGEVTEKVENPYA